MAATSASAASAGWILPLEPGPAASPLPSPLPSLASMSPTVMTTVHSATSTPLSPFASAVLAAIAFTEAHGTFFLVLAFLVMAMYTISCLHHAHTTAHRATERSAPDLSTDVTTGKPSESMHARVPTAADEVRYNDLLGKNSQERNALAGVNDLDTIGGTVFAAPQTSPTASTHLEKPLSPFLTPLAHDSQLGKSLTASEPLAPSAVAASASQPTRTLGEMGGGAALGSAQPQCGLSPALLAVAGEQGLAPDVLARVVAAAQQASKQHVPSPSPSLPPPEQQQQQQQGAGCDDLSSAASAAPAQPSGEHSNEKPDPLNLTRRSASEYATGKVIKCIPGNHGAATENAPTIKQGSSSGTAGQRDASAAPLVTGTQQAVGAAGGAGKSAERRARKKANREREELERREQIEREAQERRERDEREAEERRRRDERETMERRVRDDALFKQQLGMVSSVLQSIGVNVPRSPESSPRKVVDKGKGKAVERPSSPRFSPHRGSPAGSARARYSSSLPSPFSKAAAAAHGAASSLSRRRRDDSPAYAYPSKAADGRRKKDFVGGILDSLNTRDTEPRASTSKARSTKPERKKEALAFDVNDSDESSMQIDDEDEPPRQASRKAAASLAALMRDANQHEAGEYGGNKRKRRASTSSSSADTAVERNPKKQKVTPNVPAAPPRWILYSGAALEQERNTIRPIDQWISEGKYVGPNLSNGYDNASFQNTTAIESASMLLDELLSLVTLCTRSRAHTPDPFTFLARDLFAFAKARGWTSFGQAGTLSVPVVAGSLVSLAAVMDGNLQREKDVGGGFVTSLGSKVPLGSHIWIWHDPYSGAHLDF